MNTTTPSLFFFSGWPACGESHYGEWLAEHHDFRHAHLAANGSGDPEWSAQWEKLQPAGAREFAERLLKKHPRWVLTAEAPIEDLSRLEALQAAGFSLWFFLARREEFSRQRWMAIERELDPDVRPLEWKKQADAIRRSARGLRPFFRNQCVETLVGATELIEGDVLAVQLGLVEAP